MRLLVYFSGSEKTPIFEKISQWSLYAGTVALWITIYTGIQAGRIVSTKLCDPSVLHDHRNAAYVLGYLFTFASVVEAVSLKAFDVSKSVKRLKRWLVTILLVAGGLGLIYTAHLGASLVYQQSAGVYQPTEKCYEFK